MLHTTCGTPNYVAPEVLEDKGYDGRKADIWSCGVILYVLLAGFLPFDERTMPELFAKIQNADVQYPAFFEEDAKDLLAKILTNDPVARISLDDIMQVRRAKRPPHIVNKGGCRWRNSSAGMPVAPSRSLRAANRAIRQYTCGLAWYPPPPPSPPPPLLLF